MPSDLFAHLPLLCLIMFLGSVVQGATGFGFGLVAVAGASLFLSLKVTTPLLAILNLPVVLYLLAKLWRSIVWGKMTPLVVGMLVGVPFGVFVLVKWPEGLLMRGLALVLLYVGVRAFITGRRNGEVGCATVAPPVARDAAVGVGVGMATGALAGAFNTGGPPIVAYAYCHPWTKEQRTATIQAAFAISVAYRIAVMACAGLYSREVLVCDAALMPAAVLGMFVGYGIFKRLEPRSLEIVVALFLVCIGVKLMIWT